MASLDIRLFGALRVGRDGRALERLPGKRVKDLLAYLLLTRETIHSRDQLAGIFWGDQEDSRARHCLNTALWRLRQALGDGEDGRAWLLVDAHSIGFNPASDVRIDVADFEQRINLAERVAQQSPSQYAALLHEATALYTADLLVDCYDDWCLLERERLQRIYQRALQALATHHAAHGEHGRAIELGHRILGRDPLREDVHRDLIHQYLAARQPSEALQQYRACEDILRRELGIEPMPETQALLPRILAAWGEPADRPIDASSAPSLADVISALRSAARGLDEARERVTTALSMAERLAASPSWDAQPSSIIHLPDQRGVLAQPAD
jgi:DNA-binding SARP family transcriptional activator